MPEFKDISSSDLTYITEQNKLYSSKIQVGYNKYTTLQDVANLAYYGSGRALSSYKNNYYNLSNVGNTSGLPDLSEDILEFNNIYGITGTLPKNITSVNVKIDASAKSGMVETYADRKMPILIIIPIDGSSTIASQLNFVPVRYENSNSRVTIYRQYNGLINPGITGSGTLVISISQSQIFTYNDKNKPSIKGNLNLLVTYTWLELVSYYPQ